jgi:shikimate dehydrogenase
MVRLGVCGWPVGHSRSPAMHNAALGELGLHDWRYQHLPVPPEDFPALARALEGAGFRGVNVTIPHKEAALAVADEVTATARAVGAANTLTFEDGRIRADNTDVTALIEAIRRRRDPRGATALVLGAGGAGRAAVHGLVQAGTSDVMVWNRTPERAERLAAVLGARAVRAPGAADIVVQCTSVGLTSGRDPFKTLPLRADTFAAETCVADMVYGAGDTAFLAAARAAGADVIDGLEILVGQGAAALERWTGRPAPVEVMRRAVTEQPDP